MVYSMRNQLSDVHYHTRLIRNDLVDSYHHMVNPKNKFAITIIQTRTRRQINYMDHFVPLLVPYTVMNQYYQTIHTFQYIPHFVRMDLILLLNQNQII